MTVSEASQQLAVAASMATADPSLHHDLRCAALEYTYAVVSEIKLLDGGSFQRTLDNILGSIISTARRSAARLP